MGSDIARRTYDESRQYRKVIAQQGRAIIEADLNEAQEIATEEVRKEALDFVGPVGTPDDGYKVSIMAPGEGEPEDIHIGPGTMYVGGMRVFLPDGVFYSKQREWLEGLPPAPGTPYEQVCLHLIEREVSAVEDKPLREVALGGPDTAQRSRLLQRFVRFGFSSFLTCEAAFENLQQELEQGGLYFDSTTMRIASKATLAASFIPPDPPPDVCSPVAQAGFLGAENQLVRVQIAGTNKLLWGYDNASFLYRITKVTVDANTNTSVLTLASSPVDAYHQPRINQWVEVLVASADIGDENFVAALSGLAVQVTAQYNPADRTFEINAALQSEHLSALDTTALFVRVWEEQIEFTPDVAIPLAETGLQIVLSAPNNLFVTGEYWMIALRPAAPTQIFPERYAKGPQPPEGPRRWLCPLGVVASADGSLSVIDDCREHFDNLVELTRRQGCCTITIGPESVEGGTRLQVLIDRFKSVLQSGTKVSICLLPGVYTLDSTLHLGTDHAGLTIESCIRGAAVITANSTSNGFIDGLVAIVDTASITLRGLRFVLRNVSFEAAQGMFGCFSPTSLCVASASAIDYRSLQVAIGIRLMGSDRAVSTNISIHDCSFDYDQIAVSTSDYSFAAGLFLGGAVGGLDVCGNSFVSATHSSGDPQKFHYGCIQTPTTTIVEFDPNSTAEQRVSTLIAVLDEAVFHDNRFTGLTSAMLLHGDNRKIRAGMNYVAGCCVGIWLISADVWLLSDQDLDDMVSVIDDFVYDPARTASAIDALKGLRNDPCFYEGAAIARAYPLPYGANPPPDVGMTDPVPLTSLTDMLVAAETPLLLQLQPGPLVLHASGNDVTCAPSAALFVWAAAGSVLAAAPPAEVLVNQNRFTATTSLATAMTFRAGRVTMTGNVIVNNDVVSTNVKFSLAILPTADEQRRVAITGNVFKAFTLLPARDPWSGIAVQWQFFNHEEP